MAVEDAQAPRGHDQQAHAGEEDLHEADGELALVAVEAGGDNVDEVRGHQDADRDDGGDDQGQQRADGRGYAVASALIILAEQAGVDGDEGGGKDAFAEEILEEVGDLLGGLEGVGGVGVAEVMGEDAIADEAGDAAEENARADAHGAGEAG